MSRWKFFLTLCLCISSHCCPTELWNQKITCRPGKAISNISWREEGPTCRKYKIACENATDSCIENCTWSINCLDTNHQYRRYNYHTHHYVRGIHVLYDQNADRQKVSFLCCHANLSIHDLEPKRQREKHEACKDTFTRLDGKPSSPDETEIITQVKEEQEGAFVATFCRNDSDVPLCPLDAMKSTTTNPAGLAVLAGLAALAGLALIKCCCADPSVITCKPGCTVCPKCLGDGKTYKGNPTGCADAVVGDGHITECLYFDEAKATRFGLKGAGHYCDFWTGAFGG